MTITQEALEVPQSWKPCSKCPWVMVIDRKTGKAAGRSFRLRQPMEYDTDIRDGHHESRTPDDELQQDPGFPHSMNRVRS